MNETTRANLKSQNGKAVRTHKRYGELAKLAIELSGRSPSMVYAVLRGDVTSAPVSRAIREARRRLRARGKEVA
jgi:hypothetical protein